MLKSQEIVKAEWSAAMARFQRCGGVFVRVGARDGEDWRVSALRVMCREAKDPRGWPFADEWGWWWVPAYSGSEESEEFEAALSERKEETEAALPFFGVTEARLSRLREITADEADRTVKKILNRWVKGKPSWVVEAALRRFDAPVRYFTNIGRSGGFTPIGPYMMDFGVIVVTETEVGVIWSFEED